MSEEAQKKKKKIKPSKKRDHSFLLQHLPVGIYRTTPDGLILEANDILVEMLGYRNEAELKKLNVKDIYVEEKQRDHLVKKIESSLKQSVELKLKRKDGRIIWGRDVSLAVKDAEGCVQYYNGLIIDITKEKKAEEDKKKALEKLKQSEKEKKRMIKELKAQTLMDDLTSLYNRRGFLAVASNHMKLADRNKKPMFLLFMDLDNLKAINDTHGHHRGDEALVVFSGIMRNSFRKSDVKGRMGGDEFAVFPIGTTRRGVEIALNRFKKNIDFFNNDKNNIYELTVSMGVSWYDPKHPCSIDELLVRADKRMYEEKRLKSRD